MNLVAAPALARAGPRTRPASQDRESQCRCTYRRAAPFSTNAKLWENGHAALDLCPSRAAPQRATRSKKQIFERALRKCSANRLAEHSGTPPYLPAPTTSPAPALRDDAQQTDNSDGISPASQGQASGWRRRQYRRICCGKLYCSIRPGDQAIQTVSLWHPANKPMIGRQRPKSSILDHGPIERDQFSR